MKPEDQEEVYLAHILDIMFLHELLNFSAKPVSYLFLIITTKSSTFFTLKGANLFCQPAYFF